MWVCRGKFEKNGSKSLEMLLPLATNSSWLYFKLRKLCLCNKVIFNILNISAQEGLVLLTSKKLKNLKSWRNVDKLLYSY